jgi:ring-1,2-phenylacetyl-CoA epoxidase subunit PaaD
MTTALRDAAHESEEIRRIWEILAEVLDPEIPVLSVVDLGIVRAVKQEGADLIVAITPTYSACPATRVIERDIREALDRAGYPHAALRTVLSPPWTTAWLSEAGRAKLRRFGIAPPEEASASKRSLSGEEIAIACPRCGATDTERVSEFGSTPCKAHYRCRSCLEPFDYFKCL